MIGGGRVACAVLGGAGRSSVHRRLVPTERAALASWAACCSGVLGSRTTAKSALRCTHGPRNNALVLHNAAGLRSHGWHSNQRVHSPVLTHRPASQACVRAVFP